MSEQPAFLRKLRTREHPVGWATPCPDKHASSGFAVLIRPDEQGGAYRFECVEAANGDRCGRELELIRLLGLEEAEIGMNGAALASDLLIAIPFTAITMRSIEWFEKPLWQRSAFQLFAAPKGAGKGTYLAGLAARVSNAGGNVLFISSEDSAEIDIKPRLHAAGADMSRCFIIQRHVKLPDDVATLREIAEGLGGVDLLIVDPVANHIGDKNSNNDIEVRYAISPLNGLADKLSCLIIGVRHPGKDRTRGALASILGSIAWVDTPRAVVMIAPDDEDQHLRHIQVVAGNRSLNGSAQAFRIDAVEVPGLNEPITLAIELGESAKSVEQLLQTRKVAETRTGKARDLLLDILEEEGEQESDALDAHVARETGLAARTVRDARIALAKEGLVKAQPDKDEFGEVKRWKVHRTGAPRP